MPAPSQFFHVSLYGVAPRNGEPGWATISGITQEGARAPGAARHVSYPAEPTRLFGLSPLDAGRIAQERAALARDTRGRRLRRDGAVLAAAVCSYPVPRSLVEDRGAPDAADLYGTWRATALDWCRALFGDTLLSVVEHADEDYLHLHAFAVPDLGPGGCLRWEAIHPGRAALREAEAEKKDKSAQRAAYNAAMMQLQDDYHARVGRPVGHARLGPRRRRLDRTTHLLHRNAERKRAELDRDYAERKAQLRAEVKAEVTDKFGRVLAEARLDARKLAAGRKADAARIAELVARNERLMERMRELVWERPAPGR